MNDRERTYYALASKWLTVSDSYDGTPFDWEVGDGDEPISLTLKRQARAIAHCYLGCAEGRRSRFATLDRLKLVFDGWQDLHETSTEDAACSK